MELVPLSSDGRVTAVDATEAPAGPLRVALQPDGGGVGVVALGSVLPRPVGRFDAADAAAYAPVLRALWALRRVGTCAARVGPGGTLVLDLAPAAECVFANPPDDLVLLAAERTVAVTHEEQGGDGAVGRVTVGLVPCPDAGRRGVEVRLDGRRVGALTGPEAEHYLPVIDKLVADGRRVGCEALVGGDHGEIELRLPAADPSEPEAASVRAATPMALPTGALPIVPAGWGQPRSAPSSLAAAATVPALYPVTDAVAPRPRPSEPPTAGVQPRRPRRRAVWAGAVTVGVLVLAAVVGAGLRTDASTPTASATVTVPTFGPTTTDAPLALAPAVSPTGRAERTGRSSRTTAAPTRSARATSTGSCSPDYSPCVPIRHDVRCRDLHGHVRVVGRDVYGLDPDGDGIGCN